MALALRHGASARISTLAPTSRQNYIEAAIGHLEQIEKAAQLILIALDLQLTRGDDLLDWHPQKN
jgi:hypothetical protein